MTAPASSTTGLPTAALPTTDVPVTALPTAEGPATASCPAPSFAHLLRLSDDTGLLEHAWGAVPRRDRGYCVDDVARGLVVVCRQPSPPEVLVELAGRYLAFVAHAQTPAGYLHNRMSYDRAWRDQPGLGDWWGRAVWGLGTAAARGPTAWFRREALARFEISARRRSPWTRAMAFAALGAAEVLKVHPGHPEALDLLSAGASAVGSPAADGWPWPQPRLTYANGVLAEVLIAAGACLGDRALLSDGLRLLEWLVAVETRDGHLSVTPVGGWWAPDDRPGFDQQPIEVASLADACVRALRVTGDRRWAYPIERAVAWFLGDNDAGVPLRDAESGGCHDGLAPAGRNGNQGAESTLALISTLQHGQNLMLEGLEGPCEKAPIQESGPEDE